MGKVPGGEPLCRVGKPEALSLDQERSPPDPWEKGEPHVCSEGPASHSACLSGPAFEPGGQLTALTSSHFNLSGQVALPALVRSGCCPFEWSTRQGWGNI